MNTYAADLHTHTIASGHAYSTIKEMAIAAEEKGIRLLGITEHSKGMPGSCQDFPISVWLTARSAKWSLPWV